MSSSRRHHQTVDKLDRTITRLYTYLSGSEEGDDGPPQQQQHLGRRQLRPQQQQQHEPEYQQPYAYPAAHAHPFNPSVAVTTPNSGGSDNHTTTTTTTTTTSTDADSSLHRRRHFQGTCSNNEVVPLKFPSRPISL